MAACTVTPDGADCATRSIPVPTPGRTESMCTPGFDWLSHALDIEEAIGFAGAGVIAGGPPIAAPQSFSTAGDLAGGGANGFFARPNTWVPSERGKGGGGASSRSTSTSTS